MYIYDDFHLYIKVAAIPTKVGNLKFCSITVELKVYKHKKTIIPYVCIANIGGKTSEYYPVKYI